MSLSFSLTMLSFILAAANALTQSLLQSGVCLSFSFFLYLSYTCTDRDPIQASIIYLKLKNFLSFTLSFFLFVPLSFFVFNIPQLLRSFRQFVKMFFLGRGVVVWPVVYGAQSVRTGSCCLPARFWPLNSGCYSKGVEAKRVEFCFFLYVPIWC